MRDLNTLEYFKESEDLVNILCERTQNNSQLFFRVMVAYYFAEIASMQRAYLATKDRGDIPINVYALNLSPSGSGKTFSSNIIEHQVIHKFKERYTSSILPEIAKSSLNRLAIERALIKGTDEDEELDIVMSEYNALGEYAFSFSEGSSPACKQLRHKYLMANTGSLNFILDEIGSNIINNKDLFSMFLDVYDKGLTKQKLTKVSADNKRNAEVKGHVPSNMMLYGTPTKLFNGGKEEDEAYALLDTGYARRCFFGISQHKPNSMGMSPTEVYDALVNETTQKSLEEFSSYLETLATLDNHCVGIEVPRDVAILAIEYRMYCEALASKLAEHEEMLKAELSHRYFKASKLAGAYAFIRGANVLTEELLYNAIKLAEESGEAFSKILTRDRAYVKLAKYLGASSTELTHSDLVEDLPFYKGSVSVKNEMLNMAISYGYKNNISIKRTYYEGIEFLSGAMLEESDPSKSIISWADHVAYNYSKELAPFKDISNLTQVEGLHWASHAFLEQHRCEEKVIQGFNIAVIDLDSEIDIPTIRLLMKEYMYHIYTTKRHTEASHRCRLLLPLSHVLKLSKEEYKEFMDNLCEFLPFPVTDDGTHTRSKKWLSHKGKYWNNTGKLLSVLDLLPKTSKNDKRQKILLDTQSLSNVERWFITRAGSKGRNNSMIQYGLMLVDSGRSLQEVRDSILSLNNKLPNKLTEGELTCTVFKTIATAIGKRDE